MELKPRKKRPKRLYALFAHQRSGTHFLGALLNSSPKIYHYLEAFYPSFTKGKFFEFYREKVQEDWDNLLSTNPRINASMLRDYFKWSSEMRHRPVIGYDIKIDQSAAMIGMQHVLYEMNFKILLLSRKNGLDRVVSHFVMVERVRGGEDNFHRTALDAPMRVHIDPAVALTMIRNGIAAEDVIRKKYSVNRDRFLEVHYEDLSAKGGSTEPGAPLRRIGDFLEVDEFLVAEKGLPVKQSRWGHADVVSNWNELASAIRSSEFAAMLDPS